MRLKYQDQINLLECDFENFKEQDRESYRWVFADITDKRNFTPRYQIDETLERTNAKGWALSFFDTGEKARTKFLRMTKNKENLFKIFGTHIAKGQLNTHDGISDNSSNIGHFDLFEYENINLEAKFEISEQVAN